MQKTPWKPHNFSSLGKWTSKTPLRSWEQIIIAIRRSHQITLPTSATLWPAKILESSVGSSLW
jgi:hypothetical protein